MSDLPRERKRKIAFRDVAPPEVIAAFWEALEIENRRHAQVVAGLFDELLSYRGGAS